MNVLSRAGLVLAGTTLLAGVTVAPADAAIRPDPARADADKPPGYSNGCHLGQGPSKPVGCTYGDKNARRTIMLVGDSMARQWLPTLDRYGKKKKWRIVAHTKSACSFSQADPPSAGSASKRFTSCVTWNDRLLHRIRADKPRVVAVALYNKYARKTSKARTSTQRQIAMAKGIRASWRSATRAGSRVLVLNSTPHIGTPYPGHPKWEAADCVASNRKNPRVCDVPAAKALGARSVWTPQDRARVLKGMSRVNLVDLNTKFCSTTTCRVVIGNIMVYRDNHHMTATFARSLYPYLRNRLDPLLR